MSRRMSPKHGSVFTIFAALASIPTLLSSSNLTLEVVITVEEEVRVPDPRRNRRRGGWTTVDRRLVEIVDIHRIEHMADLFAMLDAKLPAEFTTADLANAMQSPRRLGQQAAFCFREAGLERDLRQGRERPRLSTNAIVGATAHPGGRVVVARGHTCCARTTGRDKPVPYGRVVVPRQVPRSRGSSASRRPSPM